MLAKLLNIDSINLSMKAESKEEAIEELVDLLRLSASSPDRESLTQSAMERENRMSTGLGKGVAVPRCRVEGLKAIRCCLAIKKDGLEFDALDGLPVKIFVMVAAPRTADDTYVKVLSLFYRVLNQETFRSELLKARSGAEVLSLISEEEKGFKD
jgi:mannitol/fructose-specific phosphotransferase system IIA component (Ntr-type)